MTDQLVYQVVTDKIVEQLENGTAPWRQPWTGGTAFAPANLLTGRRYSGINIVLLAIAGYSSPYWLTYKQATELGGHVRKGEKSTIVVFWHMVKARKTDPDEKDKMVPILRYYRVFNLEQCDDVRIPKGRELPESKTVSPVERVEAAEEIIAGFANSPRIVEDQPRAWYRPDVDLVNLPPRELFDEADEFYATAFHELGHSTAHSSRLGRDIANHPFGSHQYGREELVAEMTSAFLCAEAGIETTTENSAAYLRSWIKTIREDVRAVVVAAGAAQKAADHILGRVAVAEQAA